MKNLTKYVDYIHVQETIYRKIIQKNSQLQSKNQKKYRQQNNTWKNVVILETFKILTRHIMQKTGF